MTNVRMFLIAGVGVVAGCTHRKSLVDARALAGVAVSVETRDGVEEHGEVVETEGRVVVRGDRGIVELGEVVELTEVRRLRGALQGLGLGVLVGVVGGAGLGFATGCEMTTSSCFTRGDNAVVGAVVAGALGVPLGLLFGAVIGSRNVYTVVVPGGSTAGAAVRF